MLNLQKQSIYVLNEEIIDKSVCSDKEYPLNPGDVFITFDLQVYKIKNKVHVLNSNNTTYTTIYYLEDSLNEKMLELLRSI